MNKALNYSYSLSEQHTFPSIYHFSKHNTKLNLSNPKNHKALRENERHLKGFHRHWIGKSMVINGKSRENTEKVGVQGTRDSSIYWINNKKIFQINRGRV